MTANDTASLARQLYARFNAGDIDAAAGMATDDIEVVVVPFGQTFAGPDGFGAFMRGFKDAFPDLAITVENQVATDDQVVSECSWNGTHTGPLQTPAGPIPPTGRSVSGARFCEVWRVRDGKIAHLVNYQDVGTWLRQLGVG